MNTEDCSQMHARLNELNGPFGHGEVVDVGPRPQPECPNCGRVMSFREHDEQGSCSDCYSGAAWSPDE